MIIICSRHRSNVAWDGGLRLVHVTDGTPCTDESLYRLTELTPSFAAGLLVIGQMADLRRTEPVL